MATEKQIEWAVKLAHWNKKDITRKDVESLSDEQLDQLFANLKKISVKRTEKPVQELQQKKLDFNGQRFGLACKLVLESVNFDFVLNNTEIYVKRIMQYYTVMTEAEKAMKELVVVGEVDADQQRDEQVDRQLIRLGVM
jgi:hypothetical protein